MKTLPAVDAVVVGGGWTGLLIAKELGARTSLSVVVLERGGTHSKEEYAGAMDELEYKVRLRPIADYSKETITMRHSRRDRAYPIRQAPSLFPGSGIGGMGEHWGGGCPRFMPDCFELHTRTVEKYGAKRLPPDHSIQDWGITWREIEPYYVRAERLIGVSGKAGNLNGKLIEGGNVFEGPRSADYPTPPMKMPHFSTIFEQAAKSLGYHPYPYPAATISQGYTNPDGVSRPGCLYCGFCDGYPCMIDAKSQPTNTLLPVLQKQKNVEIRTGAWVRRIRHESGAKSGKAIGVTYVDANGDECFQPAELVILGAWTVNNVRLLLLSKIGEPYDPETGKGHLGRNLTSHLNIISARVFLDQPMNRFMGGASAGMRIGDLDADVFDHTSLSFLRGGNFGAMSSGYQPITTFGTLPPSVKATWGSEWKRKSIEYYDRWGFINFMGEHLAYKGNFMDLDATYKDQFGDPLLRLTIDWRDNELEMLKFATEKSVEMARAMGAKEITPFEGYRHFDVTRTPMTHTQGGAIMGVSPDNSVVNTYLQHWQMPNLFITGGSAFPQQGSVNPTPTILALIYRMADSMVDRYLAHPSLLS